MSNNPSDQSLFVASVKAIAAVAALRCAGLANAFRQIGMVADLVTPLINGWSPSRGRGLRKARKYGL
jgi:hypothetical protein